MKGKLGLAAVLLTLLLVGVVRAQTGGNYDLSWNVASVGGEQSSGGDFGLGATAGQAAPGLSAGGNYVLCAGFWCRGSTSGPPAGPRYLPALFKNFFCDPYEPNNSRSAAWGPLASGQIIAADICPGDSRDVYYFDAGGSVKVTFDLTNMPGNADFELSLWPATGADPLAGSRTGAGQDEHITNYTLPGAGTYYVDVYPWLGSSGSYSLKGSGW